ncbi:MAG: class I SAM-dependent methyltransferase [Planctomycetes bacterium]|nr:class I SAM-dependent methyltransferase [Planctomycetota bacterium]
MSRNQRKRYFKLVARIIHLAFIKPCNCGKLVSKSYDRISDGYDAAWTSHMRDLTGSLINRLDMQHSKTAIDLTCGTGFAAGLLAGKSGFRVIGVDASEGMLAQARDNYPDNCRFVHSDILEYLKAQPTENADIITCCWGLGYSKPFAVLRQIKRVLKPKGTVAIIDNTIFSLREVMYCSFLAFAENPQKLANLMRFKFLTGRRHLALLFRLCGFKPQYVDAGSRSYTVSSGEEAVARLGATGAAAGFEYAAGDEDGEEIFKRFAEIIEEKYKRDDSIKITHRYLAGIAQK